MYAQVEKAHSTDQKKCNSNQVLKFVDNHRKFSVSSTIVNKDIRFTQYKKIKLNNPSQNMISSNTFSSVITPNHGQTVIQRLTKAQICTELANWDCKNSGMQMSIEDTAYVIMIDPEMTKTQDINYLRSWLKEVGYISMQRLPIEHSEVEQELGSCEVNETFMIVRFKERNTGEQREIKASLLRHGLWSMAEASPKELNSVLLPSVIPMLEADGKELSKQLAAKTRWFGKGCKYKVGSGRIYEVDQQGHFYPVSGPQVFSMKQNQYHAVRAILIIFHSNIGSAVRKAINAKDLLLKFGNKLPLSELNQLSDVLPGKDELVDSIAREIKPYSAKSITELLLELHKEQIYKSLAEEREKRKAKEKAEKERQAEQSRKAPI